VKNLTLKKGLTFVLLIVFILSSCVPVFGSQITIIKPNENISNRSEFNMKFIELEFSFSYPEVVKYGNYWVIRVRETNHNRYVLFTMDPGKPVLPVNISIFKLEFGSEIVNIKYENSTAKVIDLPGELAYCKANYDTSNSNINEIPKDISIYQSSEPYPLDWISYHTGGGLFEGERTTFLVSRVYPVRYFPLDNQVHFIDKIKVNVSYYEPDNPVIEDNDIFDLLILSPNTFIKNVQPLVNHKNKFGVRTKLVSLDYVYNHIWYGRDRAEKIKLFIKEAIEKSGINYVLLVGAIKGQTFKWNIPVRLSHVVPFEEEQEYREKSFISDLYFADIYDSSGEFSSWDSNNDNIFSVWNDTYKDEMDLYPDVYLGRLACRGNQEVKIMVNKIINYEKEKCSEEDWFNNLILVAGDSYNDSDFNTNYNEGEVISEKAITLMPDFIPVRVYANKTTGEDINKNTINNAMNNGSGFAYFCGHGSINSWSTHFPIQQGFEWTDGYKCKDMMYLKNKEKLPIAVIGGCHNGQFDVTFMNFFKGILEEGLLGYFNTEKGNLGGFWNPKIWITNCWAWWLTSAPRGGSVATIANSGLGTHGSGDLDNNSIADYMEILDGWLELNFLKCYGTYNKDILGENHADTLTSYLNRFLGDNTRMDVKMVQQWVLFGDPSLKIGGYE
jgi:hypothetical protein